MRSISFSSVTLLSQEPCPASSLATAKVVQALILVFSGMFVSIMAAWLASEILEIEINPDTQMQNYWRQYLIPRRLNRRGYKLLRPNRMKCPEMYRSRWYYW